MSTILIFSSKHLQCFCTRNICWSFIFEYKENECPLAAVCFGKYRYSQHAAASVSLRFAENQSACINQQSLTPHGKLNSQKIKWNHIWFRIVRFLLTCKLCFDNLLWRQCDELWEKSVGTCGKDLLDFVPIQNDGSQRKYLFDHQRGVLATYLH